MPDFLQYSFMVRALIAGCLVACTVPLLGTFLVARRYSLIADSLAHVSLAGVAAGLLVGSAPLIVAIPVTVAGALALEYLRQKQRVSGETSLAIVMSSGLALAVVLSTISGGSNVDFASYLFGSIATTRWSDVWVLLAACLLVIVCVYVFRKQFLHIAIDEQGAKIAGLHVTWLNYLLMGLTALTVVLSLRIIGGLLVSALIVLPVVTAARYSSSFIQTMLLACVLALVAVVGGLITAFYAGLAAGGAIVLTALALFIATLIIRK